MPDDHPFSYRELTPDNHWMKRAYVSCALWFLGRAVQSAARFDDTVKREFNELGERFSFSLEVIPSGPAMVLEKEGDRVRFAGARPKKGPPIFKWRSNISKPPSISSLFGKVPPQPMPAIVSILTAIPHMPALSSGSSIGSRCFFYRHPSRDLQSRAIPSCRF